MSLALTDTQLDAWIAQNGPIFSGYGEFKRFLLECDRQHQVMTDELKAKLAASDAPKLYHVRGHVLLDTPF